MQLLPLLICPQERHLLFKNPQDYKHASSCQFAVHTPRILCWNKQKQKKLISVASRSFYFVGGIRRQSQTSPQPFAACTSQFASTKTSQASVQHFTASNLSRHVKVHCDQDPIKASLTLPNQPARCTDANLQLISS